MEGFVAFTKGSTLIANESKELQTLADFQGGLEFVCGMVGCSKDQKVTINGENSSN